MKELDLIPWLLLALLFLAGLFSGRDADPARMPAVLIALLLTALIAFAFITTGPSGCAGGTCVADGIVLIPLLAMGTGLAGYYVAGVLSVLTKSGVISEAMQARLRLSIRLICGLGIVFGVTWILS